jgi:tRNA nucleotidyltransferase (CCA-adding enzyme)
MKVPFFVSTIAQLVRKLGGQAYLVGGAVVDHLRGVEPKDWDIEVYSVPFPVLQKALEDGGYNPKLVGREFGVLKVNGGLDVDVSVPRHDNKIGAGHKDFEVVLDPNMSPMEAARRRDLTINSLFFDLETNEVKAANLGIGRYEKELISRVCALSRNHMQPYFLNSGQAKASIWDAWLLCCRAIS